MLNVESALSIREQLRNWLEINADRTGFTVSSSATVPLAERSEIFASQMAIVESRFEPQCHS
jgi:hypothetical protein